MSTVGSNNNKISDILAHTKVRRHSNLFLIHYYCCLNVLTLSNQEQNDKNSFGEWSPWSPWSSCSRICDGGISTSVRRCLSRTGCIGQHKRNKLCNMQPCIIKTNFRQTQCSAFNDKPYRDRFYEWIVFIDPTDPCSLTCKANGLNFVAKLAPYITDGTRCRPDSLDVCVSGKCLSVGCDLQLGSSKKIDDCGVCGGDGSSCKNHSYFWSHHFLSNCSKSCDGGSQSIIVCLNESTSEIVDDIYCSMKNKPEPSTNTCNEIDCKPNWVTEDWSQCSEKCGIGVQTRNVYCALKQKNQIKIEVDEKLCTLKKPDLEKKCNLGECPQWYKGPWSECSETCGNGIQHRHVVCKNNKGFLSDKCDVSLKPISRRNCSDISSCLNGKLNSQENSPRIDLLKRLAEEPSFDVGHWSPCNVTCGKGYKKRSVKCRIYLEFSKTFATIPSDQCSGTKPSEFEVCYGFDCNLDEKEQEHNKLIIIRTDNVEKYLWTVTGFTKCSEHCLGGTQESIIECVRERDNKRMPPEFCPIDSKPETYTRICNDQPCIPRWNLSEFGKCSKKCGEGGLQTRIVLCVHEVVRGPNNFVVVPDNHCHPPKPSTEQKCNQIDCSARWIVDPWQKCSKDCGGGIKKRNIHCVKDYVFGGLQNVSHLECSIRKPKTLKQCNLKSCRASYNHSTEIVRKSKRNHFIDSLHKLNHKYSFKVQGKVTVFESSRVKLSCPGWIRQSSPVTWLKGHEFIENNRKFIMMENFLKIRNIKLVDTGVYKCFYDDDTVHSMFLHVLPRKVSNFLNDQYVTEPTYTTDSANHYYQNELDVSQEMEKYSLKSESKGIKINSRDEKSHYFGENHPTRHKGSIHELSHLKTPSTNSKYNLEDKVANKIFGLEKNVPIMLHQKLKTKFNWITTAWSNCTIPCGGLGFKIRLSQCYARMGNMTRIVEDSFCIDAGLQKPNTFETCGLESCSYWRVGQWSECQGCIDINKGIQSRDVTCSLDNGTIIEDSICFQWRDKPIIKQECYHSNCVPTWQVGDWSKCPGDVCTRNGSRIRTVKCVWKSSQQSIDESLCEETKPNNIES